MGPELSANPEVYGPMAVFAKVLGPHTGELLSHSTEGVLHCSRSDAVMAGGQAAVSVSLSEELEDWDWINKVA